MAATKPKTPESITGGCLCGNVRYKATITSKHDWDDCVGTCQCTICRKNTGSLYFHWHHIQAEDLVFTSQEGLKIYQATPGKNRGFCSQCGSFLFYKGERSNNINVAVGSIDEDLLKDYGFLLTNPGANLYCKNEIKGVTDGLPGEKFDTAPVPPTEGSNMEDQGKI